MESDSRESISRKTFLKAVTGAAFCCACSSWSCSKLQSGRDGPSHEPSQPVGKAHVHLAGACGIYCGACPAYLNKHGQARRTAAAAAISAPIDRFVRMMEGLVCDGCLSGGTLAAHCRTCSIRLCAANRQNDGRCAGCADLPCFRVTNLIRQGNYPHRQEYLPNLEKIRQMGVEKWVTLEEARWRCTRCRQPMSWYDAACAACGEPRSGRLFPLTGTSSYTVSK